MASTVRGNWWSLPVERPWNPNDDDALNQRGIAYYYKGDYDRAITDFTEAIRIDPSTQSYRSNLQAVQNAEARER